MTLAALWRDVMIQIYRLLLLLLWLLLTQPRSLVTLSTLTHSLVARLRLLVGGSGSGCYVMIRRLSRVTVG